jgi:hypothetical protein
MIRHTLVMTIICLMALCFSGEKFVLAEKNNQVSQLNRRLTDFEFLYSEIKNYYINLKYKESLFEFNWDSLYTHNLPEFTDKMDDTEFFKICSQFVSHLKDGHTVFRPNNSMTWSSVFSDYSKIQNIFEIRSIQNKNIIIGAQPSYSKYIGHEIMELNNTPFDQIVDSMTTVQYISSNDAGVKYKIFQRKLYFWYFDLFAQTVPSEFIFKLKDGSGGFTSVSFNRLDTYSNQYLARNDSINFGINASNLPVFKVVNGDIGYVNIPTFDLDNQTLLSFSQNMDHLKSLPIRSLIIDIRYNNGGNESYKKILEYGTSKEIHFHQFRYRNTKRFNELYPGRILNNDMTCQIAPDPPEPGYTHWWIGTLEPAAEQFFTTIPIALLTNESIFSSACDFANVCLKFDLATVIGNRVPLTGFGLPETVVLPSNNYHILYSFHEDREIDGAYLENQSKEPDIFAEQTLADFYGGVDTQLEKAIDFLENMTGIKAGFNNSAKAFQLYSNYPNPFNTTTNIKYSLSKPDHVSLKLYNVLGREIQTLVNEYQEANDYLIRCDASILSSGVYFYGIKVGDAVTEKRKMIFIK